MRVQKTFPLGTIPSEYNPDAIRRIVESTEKALCQLATAINGSIGFGDGTDYDNLKGAWSSFTSNGGAGVETTIAHNLGVVPILVLFAYPPASGTVNKGATAWDTTNLYLTFSAASQAMQIFVVIPSQPASA